MLGLSALSQILAISGIFKMELLEQQNSLDFKIGMLAPSKAGKTTLLAATMEKYNKARFMPKPQNSTEASMKMS